jgi:hypothetical protein
MDIKEAAIQRQGRGGTEHSKSRKEQSPKAETCLACKNRGKKKNNNNKNFSVDGI